MSHSITTTASYVLSKYSRSYPSTSLQGAQGPVESEWQHFTNPVMRIILEAKKSPSGELVSMRLRILWNIHTESNDLHTNQGEVVFENLELLSFSSFPTFPASTALQSDQSLPLKAVYRDAIVGIRYLHPRIAAPSSQPMYRRFQITFKDAPDALQFIDAIKSVCPCKANPQPAHINRQLSASLTATTASGPVSMRPTRLTGRQSISSPPVDSGPVPSTILGHSQVNQVISIASSSVATSLSSDDTAFVTCSETSQRADNEIGRHRKGGLSKSNGHDLTPTPLPNSSQPPSSDQSIAMPPPPVPRPSATRGPSGTINTNDQTSQFLVSLSEHPSLYELPRAELENLVGQVIREEGFLQLLDSLDSLWKVKGLLDR